MIELVLKTLIYELVSLFETRVERIERLEPIPRNTVRLLFQWNLHHLLYALAIVKILRDLREILFQLLPPFVAQRFVLRIEHLWLGYDLPEFCLVLADRFLGIAGPRGRIVSRTIYGLIFLIGAFHASTFVKKYINK